MISQLKMLSSCNPAEKISEGFFWSSSVENIKTRSKTMVRDREREASTLQLLP